MESLIDALSATGTPLASVEAVLNRVRDKDLSGSADAALVISKVCSLLVDRLSTQSNNEETHLAVAIAARSKAVDILARLPIAESHRPGLAEVTGALVHTMRTDVEDNAAAAAKALALIIKQYKHFDRSWRAERDGWMRLPEIVDAVETMLVDVGIAVAEICNDGYDPLALADVAALQMGRGVQAPMRALLDALTAVSVPGSRSAPISRSSPSSRPADLVALLSQWQGAATGGEAGAAMPPPSLPGRYSPKVLFEALTLLVSHSSSEPVKRRCGVEGVQGQSQSQGQGVPRQLGGLLSRLMDFCHIITLPDAACLAAGIIPSQAQAAMNPYLSRSDSSSSATVTGAGTGEGGQPTTTPSLSLSRIRASFLHDLHLAAGRAHFFLATAVKPLYSLSELAALYGRGGVDAFTSHLIRLFAVLPPEASSTRKELLNVLRHYLGHEIECRTLFARELTTMLNPRVLLGSADASIIPDTLRALAYQICADYLLASRERMCLEHLSFAATAFAGVLNDPCTSTSLALLAARTLNSIAEVTCAAPCAGPVYDPGEALPAPLPALSQAHAGMFGSTQWGDRTPARAVLVSILQVSVAKVGALRCAIPRVLAAEKRALAHAESTRVGNLRQITRISAAADLVATETKAKLARGADAVDTGRAAAHSHANTLLSGLERGVVSPWMADEYAEWSDASAGGGGAGSAREVRQLFQQLQVLVRMCISTLVTVGRAETLDEMERTAQGIEGHYDAQPGTPGVDAGAGVTVVTVTAGGPNGLGQYQHGVTLGEGELRLLSRNLQWSTDCLDAFVLSPSSQPEELAFSCTEYAALLDVLAANDRNHLRDLLAVTLPTILERCFRHAALFQLLETIASRQYFLMKVTVDSLMYLVTRHVHFLNVDDEDDSGAWRQTGPGAPAAHVSSAVPDLPGHWTHVKAENKLLNSNRVSVSSDRRMRQLLRGRMIAAGDWNSSDHWRFNEDGEFNEVLDPDAPTPDAELAAQQERLPTLVLAPSPSPGETVRKRALAYAGNRAMVMLKVLRLCLSAFGDFADALLRTEVEQGRQGAESKVGMIRVESLATLKPYIGPLVRSLLRNALAVHGAGNHLYALRQLMRLVATECQSLDSLGPGGIAQRNSIAHSTVTSVYAEFAPLIPQLMDSLLRLHACTTDSHLRGGIIEVAITVPLKLNMQLPHIPRLLRMLILGLRWREDKRTYPAMALRTLEYWADNISRHFWEYIFQDSALHNELMTALTALLRQPIGVPGTAAAASSLSIEVLKILPKLGGLNRSHMGAAPRLAYSAYGAFVPGAAVSARWGVGRSVYIPPADFSVHDQKALEAIFEGRLPRAGGVVDDVGDGSAMAIDEGSDVAQAALLSVAQRAIASMRARGLIGGPVGGSPSHAPSGTSTDSLSPGPADFTLPLDRIIHCAHGMLARHLTYARAGGAREGDGEEEGDGGALLAPVQTTPHPRVQAGQARVRRKRVQPSAVSHTLYATGAEDYARPVRRRRRQEDNGEPVAVLPNAHYRPLTPAVASSCAASRAARSHVTCYEDVYCSDSDSSGEEEGMNDTPIMLTPTQQLFAAQRGPLVSKKAAWDLLQSVTPYIMHHMLGGGELGGRARGAAAHLYTSDGTVRTWDGEGVAPHQSPSSSNRDDAMPLGYDGTASIAAQAESSTARRRMALEYMRALALACADVALRPLAHPLFMALLRSAVIRSVTASAHPVRGALPTALQPGAVDTLVGGGLTMPHIGVAAGSEGACLAGDWGHAPSAVHTHPSGSDDPLLLNVLLVSLACDERPPAPLASEPGGSPSAPHYGGGHPFRALLCDCLDEVVGTLALIGREGSRGGEGLLEGQQWEDLHSSQRAALADPVACVHAVAVTGRLLLSDLISRLGEAACAPAMVAKQGACHAITALLARAGPALAQAYATDILRLAFTALSSYELEQGALTVVAAFNVVQYTVDAVLPVGLPSEGALVELPHLCDPTLCLSTFDKDRLSAVVKHASEWVGATSAAAREGAAGAVGAIARHFLTREARTNSVAVSRAVLALFSPYAASMHTQHVRRSVRAMKAAEVVGYLCTVASLLNLCTEAGAGTAADASSPMPAWRVASSAFTSHSCQRDHAASVYDMAKLNRVHDVNAILVNPAYSSAVATFATLRGTNQVIGHEGAMHGSAAAPLSVMGALSSIPMSSSSVMVNVSAASNPPLAVTKSAVELHALLAAVQAFPYPMCPPGTQPRNMGPPGQGAVHGAGTAYLPLTSAWIDPWPCMTDPFTVEQIQGGTLTCHMHGLPTRVGGMYVRTEAVALATATIAGVLPQALGLMAGPHSVVGDLRGLRAATDGYGQATDPCDMTLGRFGGGIRAELQPRPYAGRLVEGAPEFRPLPYSLLLRVSSLRFIEALARAIPALITSGLSKDERDAAVEGGQGAASSSKVSKDDPPSMVRFVCPTFLLDTIPLVNPTFSNCAEISGRKLVDEHQLSKVAKQVEGHHKLLIASLGSALEAFAPLLRQPSMMGVLNTGLRPVVTMLLGSGPGVGAGGGGGGGHPSLLYTEGAGTQHLDMLAVLVSRLGASFSPALADALLGHLEQYWVPVNVIRDSMMNSGREVDLAGAIANLFHLLPLEPVSFFPRFARVAHLLDVKMHLFRNKGPLTSTIRRPFARFLSAHPAVACAWMFEPRRLLNPAWCNLLLGCSTQVPDADAFLSHLRSRAVTGLCAFVAACFPDAPSFILDGLQADGYAYAHPAPSPAPMSPADVSHLHGVGCTLLRAVSEGAGGRAWLPGCPPIIALLLHVWHAPSTLHAVHPALDQHAPPPPAPAVVWEKLGPASTDAAVHAASLKALAARQVFPCLPWRTPQLLWQGGWDPYQGLLDMLAGLVQQAGVRARVLAEERAKALATGGGATVPFALSPALPQALLLPVLCAVLSSFQSGTRLSITPIRAMVEEEFATAPDAGLREALLAAFVGGGVLPVGALTALPHIPVGGDPSPSCSALGSVAACVSDPPSHDPALQQASILTSTGLGGPRSPPVHVSSLALRVRALGMRHVLQPLTRHCVSSEERISRAAEGEGGARAQEMYILAGGRYEAAAFAVRVDGRGGESGHRLRTGYATSGTPTGVGDVRMDVGGTSSGRTGTPYPAPTARTPQGTCPGSGGGGGMRTPSTSLPSQPRSLMSSHTPFSPFSSATPRLAGLSWSEAVYAHGPGGGHRGSGAASNTRAGQLDPHAVFAASFPFTRLLPSSWVTLLATLLADLEGEEIAEAKAMSGQPALAGEAGSPLMAAPAVTGLPSTATPLPLSAASRPLLTDLRVEIMRLLETALVTAAEEAHAHRRTIVRVAWRHIKRGEPALRAQGVMVMARYGQMYQLPAASGLQLLNHLLGVLKPNPSQPNLHLEYRDTHRRALNILLPSMAMRSTDVADWYVVERLLRKTLVEDTPTVPALTSLLPLLIDHARLLYRHRDAFIAALTSSIHKVVSPSATQVLPLSHKHLVTDTLSVLATWQAQARLEALLAGLPHIQGAGVRAVGGAGISPALGEVGAGVGSSSRRRVGDRTHAQYPFPESGLGAYDANGTPLPEGIGAGDPAAMLHNPSGSTSDSSPSVLQAFIVGYAAKASVLAADCADSRGPLQQRSTALFAALLRLWPDVSLLPAHFARGTQASTRLTQMKVAVTAAGEYLKQQTATAAARAAADGTAAGFSTPRVPVPPNTPSAMGAGQEEVHAYSAALLELLLAVSGGEGRVVDFLADHPGFLMEAAMLPALLSSDKRSLALIRRLVRRLLVLYPASQPPLRFELSRLYHWLLVTSSFRVVLYNALTTSMKREDRASYRQYLWQSISQGMRTLDAPATLRGQYKEALDALGKVAAGEAYSPMQLKAGVDKNGQPLPAQSDKANNASQYVKYFFPDFTADRAASYLESYEGDKKLATAVWETVETEFIHPDLLCRPGTPGYVVPTGPTGAPGSPPQGFVAQSPNSLHVHALGILRILRDAIKYAPHWNNWTAHFLTHPVEAVGAHPSLLVRLARFQLDAEEFHDRQSGGERANPALVAPSPDHADSEVRALRASALTLLLPLLITRDNLVRPMKADIARWARHLLNASSDPGILRTSFRVLEALLTARSSPDVAVIQYGSLSERDQRDTVLSAFLFLSIPDIGPQGMNRAVALRIKKVPQDVFNELSAQYFGLLAKLCLGSTAAARSVPSVLRALRGLHSHSSNMPEVVSRAHRSGSGSGRASLYWLSTLHNQFVAGTLASQSSVRDMCMAVCLGFARWKRVHEFKEEVERIGAGIEASAHARQMRASKRSAGMFSGPLAPHLAFSVPDPFATGRMVSSQLDIQSAAYNSKGYKQFEEVRYSYHTLPEGEAEYREGSGAKDVLQTGVDAHTAAALEAAVLASTSGGGLGARRGRFLAYAGVESQPCEDKEKGRGGTGLSARLRVAPRTEDAMAGVDAEEGEEEEEDTSDLTVVSALTCLQDVLSLDWDGARAYVWTQTAVRMLVGGIGSITVLDKGHVGPKQTVQPRLTPALSALDMLDAAQVSFIPPSLHPSFRAALASACVYSVDLSAHLWQALFPPAWASLSSTARERLSPWFAHLLSKESHNLFSKDTFTELVRRTGNAVGQTASVIGVQLSQRERDQGSGPGGAYAEVSWSSSSASAAICTGSVGRASLLLGSVEEPSYGNSSGGAYFPSPYADMSTLTAVQVLAGPLLSCSPPLPLPVEVLVFLGRNAGLYESAVRVLEVRLEEGIAGVRRLEDRVRAAQRSHAAAAGGLAVRLGMQATSGMVGGGMEEEGVCLLDSKVYAAAIARHGAVGDGGSPAESSSVLPYYGAPLHTSAPSVVAVSSLNSLGPASSGAGGVGTGKAAASAPALTEDALNDLLSTRQQCAQLKAEVLVVMECLVSLYNSVGLEDLSRGLKRRFATTLATARALDYECAGLAGEVSDLTGASIVCTKDLSMAGPREEKRSLGEATREAAIGAGLGLLIGKAQLPAAAADADMQSLPPSDPLFSAPALKDKPVPPVDDLEDELTGRPNARRYKHGFLLGLGRKRKAHTAFPAHRVNGARDWCERSPLLSPLPSSLTQGILPHATQEGGGAGAWASVPAHANLRAGALADRKSGLAHLRSLVSGRETETHAMESSPPPPGLQLSDLYAEIGASGAAPGASSSLALVRNRAALLRMLSTLNVCTPEASLLRDADLACLYTDSTVDGQGGSTIPTAPGKEPALSLPAPTHGIAPGWEVLDWEGRWVNSQRSLANWKGLAAHASRTGDSVLQAEACAALGQWEDLYALVAQGDATLAQETNRNANARLLVAQLSVNLPKNIDRMASQGLEEASALWLGQWFALPALVSSSSSPFPAHEALMLSAQRITEVREGLAAVLALREVEAALRESRHAPTIDVKSLIAAWRERLPNNWEDSAAWYSVMAWRFHLFNLVQERAKAADKENAKDDTRMIALHDGPWTILRIARMARKQGLRGLAAQQLARLNDIRSMDVHDMTGRAHEELALYLPDKTEAGISAFHLRGRLMQLETNLAGEDSGVAYATPHLGDGILVGQGSTVPALARLGLALAQSNKDIDIIREKGRSDFFRLQGAFSEVSGRELWPAAYLAYSAAASHCPTHGKTWLHWAQYLDRLHARLRVEVRNPRVTEAMATVPAAAPASASGGDGMVEEENGKTSPPPPSPALSRATNPLLVAADLVVKAAGEMSRNAEGAPGTATEGDGGGAAGPLSPAPISSLPVLVACQAISAYMEAIGAACSLGPLQLARPLFLAYSAATPIGPQGGVPAVGKKQGFNMPSDDAIAAGNVKLMASLGVGAGNLPVWLWIPWLPQLISGLNRPEDPLFRLLLRSLVYAYPQAVQYHIRAAMHDRNEEWLAAGSPASVPGSPDPLVALRELYSVSKHLHPSSHSIDMLCEEVTSRLSRVSVEEDLLHNLQGLTIKTSSHAAAFAGYRVAAMTQAANAGSGVIDAVFEARIASREADLTRNSATALAKLANNRLVKISDDGGISGMSPTATARHNAAVAAYRTPLLLDFSPFVHPSLLSDSPPHAEQQAATQDVPNPHAPVNMEQLLVRLRLWRSKLLSVLVLRHLHRPSEEWLADVSSTAGGQSMAPAHASTHFALAGGLAELEVPGQYQACDAMQEPVPSRHVRIVQLCSGLQSHLAGAGVSRRLIMLGDDGRRHAGGLSATHSAHTAQDARMVQAQSFLSALMAKHAGSRARHLTLPPTPSVPLGRYRLTSDVPGVTLLHDVLEKHLRTHAPLAPRPTAHGREDADARIRSVDDLMASFRLIYSARGAEAAAAAADAGTKAPSVGAPAPVGPADVVLTETYRDMTRSVHEQALLAWAAGSMASPEAFAGLRLRFGRSLTCTSLLSVLLSLTDRSLLRLGVSLATGSLVSTDCRPAYSPGPPSHALPCGALLEQSDGSVSVPFRMTRNLVALASPQALLGTVAGGMSVAARGLVPRTEWLAAYFALVFRDEVTAVVLGLQGGGSVEPPSLLRRAMSNTGRVLERVHAMAGSVYGPAAGRYGAGSTESVVPLAPAELLSSHVHNLLLSATADKYLMRMPAAWHPWF